jgi:hypothetical protein
VNVEMKFSAGSKVEFSPASWTVTCPPGFGAELLPALPLPPPDADEEQAASAAAAIRHPAASASRWRLALKACLSTLHPSFSYRVRYRNGPIRLV